MISLSRKHKLCKICNAFDDETLTNLNLDLLGLRNGSDGTPKTWKQISEEYSPKMLPGIKGISDVNLNHHKYHCDPARIAEEVLARAGVPVSDGEIVSKLYAERYKEAIDRNIITQELYRERIYNVEILKGFQSQKMSAYNELKEKLVGLAVGSSIFSAHVGKMKSLEKEIIKITQDIDEMQGQLHTVVLKDLQAEKGIGEGQVHVTQNYINVFNDGVRDFLKEVTPYVLLEVFPDDLEKGQLVLQHIAQTLDKHIVPVLSPAKMLKGVTAEVVN